MEEHPDRESHPGLTDIYENPHPSVRDLQCRVITRTPPRIRPFSGKVTERTAPR
jgi:hypothetical protein